MASRVAPSLSGAPLRKRTVENGRPGNGPRSTGNGIATVREYFRRKKGGRRKLRRTVAAAAAVAAAYEKKR